MDKILEDADIAFARLLWSSYINTDIAARFAMDEIHKIAARSKCSI